MSHRLLWISRYGYSCSYSYVTQSLFPHLVRALPNWDIYVFSTGITHPRDHQPKLAQDLGLPLNHVFIIDSKLLTPKTTEDTEYASNYFSGIYHLEKILQQVQPDIIVALDDNLVILHYWKFLRSITWNFSFKFIPYIAIDYAKHQDSLGKLGIQHILTMSEFGKTELHQANPDLHVTVIPHVVDPDVFYPHPNRSALRKKWMGPGYDTAFVVGAFNANNTRKRWDLLLHAFGIMAMNHPDVVLLMKVPYLEPKDNYYVTNCGEYHFPDLLQKIRQKYGLHTNRLVIIAEKLPDHDINELYNCCDIGLTTTSGEGWGLTPCEMAACRIPQLVPNWSSFSEIFPGSEGLIPVKPHPLYVGRHFGALPTELNDLFIPVAKSYVNCESLQKNVESLMVSVGIPTLCISPYARTSGYHINSPGEIVAHVGTVAEAITVLKSSLFRVYPDRCQILICLDLEFLQTQGPQLKELYASLPTERRVNYCVSEESFRRFWDLTHEVVAIPTVEDTVIILEKFYQSPELRRSQGEKDAARIKELCSREKIIRQLAGYLNGAMM
jgi:glycosyltransferase involved in cell wall biosynthesis